MNGVRLPYSIIRVASLLTPIDRRPEWIKEWRSELWYVPRHQAVRFCLGAFRDAIDLRRSGPKRVRRQESHLKSPISCIACLALLAMSSMLVMLALPIRHPGLFSPISVSRLLRGSPGMLLFSCLLLPGTVAIWRRPSNHDRSRPNRFRLAAFMAVKIALLQPTMLCVFLFHVLILPKGGLGGLGFDVLFILALRWLISDQQQRCPVCLHLLTAPVSIGTPARSFLEWYGTESACPQGHGLLHISGTSFSYSRKPNWLSLDDSWQDLFAQGRNN